MYMGGWKRNCFTISLPPMYSVTNEDELLTILYNTPETRLAILEQARSIRENTIRTVWAHHEHLLFPLPVNVGTTDQQLIIAIHQRMPTKPPSHNSKL